MFKCNTKNCMYYTVIKKNGRFEGFCDWNNQFFYEMTQEAMLEREENCTDCKPRPISTKI